MLIVLRYLRSDPYVYNIPFKLGSDTTLMFVANANNSSVSLVTEIIWMVPQSVKLCPIKFIDSIFKIKVHQYDTYISNCVYLYIVDGNLITLNFIQCPSQLLSVIQSPLQMTGSNRHTCPLAWPLY